MQNKERIHSQICGICYPQKIHCKVQLLISFHFLFHGTLLFLEVMGAIVSPKEPREVYETV